PAVNVGISVSRVGGNAQTKAMKKVAGKLRLDLAQYRELEAFAQFASDLDAGTKAQLARGERTVEVLKQQTAAVWPMEEQVATIFAVGQGLMDDVPVEEIKRFENEMITALREMPSAALKAIKDTKALEDDTAATLREEISRFKSNLWKPADPQAAQEAAKVVEAAEEESEAEAEAEAPEPEAAAH
ncbi:MAG: F0F1 ATP synthase subunit alpha, partial [Acidimicrobiia bacterium]